MSKIDKITLFVKRFPFHKAYEGFRQNGISEGAFRGMLSAQFNLTVLPNTYPDLYVVIDEAQIRNIGANSGDFIMIGSSRAIALTKADALDKFKEVVGETDLIVRG